MDPTLLALVITISTLVLLVMVLGFALQDRLARTRP